jgi:hypothetical protein
MRSVSGRTRAVLAISLCAVLASAYALASGDDPNAGQVAVAQACAPASGTDRSRPAGRLPCPWQARPQFIDSPQEALGTLFSIARTNPPKSQLIAATFVSALTLGLPSVAPGTTLRATPETLDRVVAKADPGSTVELVTGNYGIFEGGLHPDRIKLEAAQGADVTMALNFRPASNLVIEGVTISEAMFSDSRTQNITVRNSDIPGQVTLRTGELARANILFANNVHRDWDAGCNGCPEGRVWLPERTSEPSGITIRDSEFRGGLSDGIQNGSNGTQIINNTFHDLEPGTANGVHTDAIQLYGSQNTVIRGNYFYDVPDAIMSPDGADHELIEDNVVAGDPGGYPYAVTLSSDNGSIIRHNTFADGNCAFNLPCGIVRIDAKSGDDAGRGTVVEDNILSEVAVDGGSAALARRSHNLIAHDRPSGVAEITGLPTFVGGPSPTAYAAYRLAPKSRGAGNASDGLDRGARIGVTTCNHAKAAVKKAKAKVRRAKAKVKRANGADAVERAEKQLRRAKQSLRKAKSKQRGLC